MYNSRGRILRQDSYKYSHFDLYPDELQGVTSYIEPRGPAGSDVVFNGLNYILKTDLSTPITYDDVKYIKSYIEPHVGVFNEKGFNDIVNKLGGYLPLEIQALPEGTVHQTGIPQIQIRSTREEFAWAPSFFEDTFLRVWYPTSVATISYNVKQVCKEFLAETSDDPSAINFMLHDFGFRAASSHESGGIGGFGHLINFMGTDTVESLVVARECYGEHMAAYSVIATEHSIATIWGVRRENQYLDRVLTKIENSPLPFPIASIVSDSYNLWDFIRDVIGGVNKERITKLKGRLVIRPDSGDPRVVPLKVIEMLGEIFGFTVNSKGYKVLPNFIRVIQGDGVNRESIYDILLGLKKAGWSAENIVFGMGGKLLGAPQRDDFRYAQKVNSATLDDEIVDVYKNPQTDPGKASKAGRQAVIRTNGKLLSIPETDLKDRENELKTVWKDGELFIDPTLVEMRARAA